MRCERSLPVSAYHPHQGASYGFSKKCRECANREARENRARRGADHWRWQKIKSCFNLSQEDYEALWESQGSSCGSCQGTEPGPRGWHVDHDHACCPAAGRSCGKCIRGILCHSCNLMLGHAKDDSKRLASGIRYLEGGAWPGRKSN